MTGQISREVAFRTLEGIRENRRKAHQRWGGYGFTSKGTLCKTPSDAAATEEEARRQAENMTRLNGKPFVARPLS